MRMKLTPIKLVLIDDWEDEFFDLIGLNISIDVWAKILHSIVTPMDRELDDKLRWVMHDKIQIATYETYTGEIDTN